MTDTLKRKRKAAAWGLSLCMLGSCLALPPVQVQAADEFTSLESLAADKLHHYNGIIFGDWTTTQADVEGAIMVGGNVELGTLYGFSIGANGDKIVMGDYDPKAAGYPVAVLGTDPAKGHTMKFKNVGYSGYVATRQSSQGYYDDAFANSWPIGSSWPKRVYTDDALVDGLFDAARSFTSTALSAFGSTGATPLPASQVFGGSGFPSDPSAYEAGALGRSNVLVLPISGESVDTGNINLPTSYAGYDLVVLYFTEADSVKLGELFVDGPCFTNTPYDPNSAASQKQMEWTNRMVYMFPEATAIDNGGKAVTGSVFAPKAHFNGSGGSVNGMLIANSLHQEGGFELHAFTLNPIVVDVVEEGPDPEPEPEYTAVSVVKLALDGHNSILDTSFRLEYDTGGGWADYYASYPSGSLTGGSIATGGDGVVRLTGLLYSTGYRLVELESPAGYELPADPYTYFAVDDAGNITAGTDGYGQSILGENGYLRVYNKALETSVSFTKVDEAGPLAGARFTLRRVAGSGYETIATDITSGVDGSFALTGLTLGSYELEETEAPAGHIASGAVYTIQVRAGDAGSLAVTITNSLTGETVGAGTQPYEIFNETEEPEPEPEPYGARFVKRSTEGQPLEGAVFDVYEQIPAPEQEEQDEQEPEEEDTEPEDAIEPDIDIPQEEEQPDALEPEPEEQQEEEQAQEEPENKEEPVAEEPDEPEQEQQEPEAAQQQDVLPLSVRMMERDNAPAQDEDNECETVGCEYHYSEMHWRLVASGVSTADNGSIYSIEQVDPDLHYLLVETSSPEGYVLPEGEDCHHVYQFATEGRGETGYVETIYNEPEPEEPGPGPEPEPVYGSFTFAKTRSDTGESIAGAAFSVVRVYTDGQRERVQGPVRMQEGTLTFTDLEEGDYYLFEDSAPGGYIDEPGIRAWFTISEETAAGGDGSEASPYTGLNIGAGGGIAVQNTPITATLRLRKVEQGTSTGLAGAEFALYRVEQDSSLTELYTGLTTGEDGVLEVENLLPGLYRLQETRAPEGYVLPEGYRTINITMDENGELEEVYDIIVTNRPEETEKPEPTYTPGRVTITKLDCDDTTLCLENTSFEVYRYTGDDALARTALPGGIGEQSNWTPYPNADSNRLTTNANGIATMENLDAGLYRIDEIEPPEGYGLWGGEQDTIYFLMVEEQDADGNIAVELGLVYYNHLEDWEDGVVFANQATPLVDTTTQPTTDPSTDPTTTDPTTTDPTTQTPSDPSGGSTTSSSGGSTTSGSGGTGRIASTSSSAGSSSRSGVSSAYAAAGRTYASGGSTGSTGSTGGATGGSGGTKATGNGGSGAKTVAQTGDNASASLLGAALVGIAAAAAIVFTALLKRRRGK